mmetsp:Transcript_8376/g.20153  ORF Transcript_8376/g.20153 Transcript_8376/m.20153 type:complete len:83 (-) Transcript_8376:2895-3143(-)
MPTLLLVKNRKAIHHVQGFDEFGGTEDFSATALAYVLGQHGILDPSDDEDISEDVLKMKGVNSIRLKKGARRGYHYGDEEFD